MLLQTLLLSFWLFIPAYVANPAAVLFGGGTPMDFGRKWRDGRRLLGDGKTWRGFLGGGFSGVFVGSIQWFSTPLWEGTFSPFIRFLGPVFALSFGALLGDVLGSFLKRRLGMDKGSRAPVLDQYDFVLGALVLTAVIFPAWMMAHYVLGEAVFGLILIIVITPILHRTVNIIGYKIGKKEVPW
ncbi:MAG: CDP-2,3-bis-(O-geranylgeranyl)-sn-glycerol synthase [Candidatus Thermoplasmatota archaeon]|nr:CDP-2,3-bis-(O-geranylgeranyl)-sn-glycerol synthase [Candidatus Thermoplasmatota archaeon]